MDNHFIKADDNKIINEKCIRWVYKMNDCLEICSRSNGCSIESGQTHRVCKLTNNDSYNKLNAYFESKK